MSSFLYEASGRESTLPERYQDVWPARFDELVTRALGPDLAVLDVGCGDSPAVPPAARPSGVRYVGIDLREEALFAAPPGSFDEAYVLDISREIPKEIGPFDLAVSWQVLEHVRPLRAAIDNVRDALRPGGRFIALTSGRYALFSVANRLLPQRLGVALMKRLLRRPEDSVFEAFYDSCFASALATSFKPWSDVEIRPLYRGAEYLAFAPRVQRAYVRYENWALRSGRANLATHYLIEAVR